MALSALSDSTGMISSSQARSRWARSQAQPNDEPTVAPDQVRRHGVLPPGDGGRILPAGRPRSLCQLARSETRSRPRTSGVPRIQRSGLRAVTSKQRSSCSPLEVSCTVTSVSPSSERTARSTPRSASSKRGSKLRVSTTRMNSGGFGPAPSSQGAIRGRCVPVVHQFGRHILVSACPRPRNDDASRAATVIHSAVPRPAWQDGEHLLPAIGTRCCCFSPVPELTNPR